MIEQTLITQVREITERANLMFKINIAIPEVHFFENKRYNGIANQKANRVGFNVAIARANPDEFINTVIHEVSHLVVWQLYPYAKQDHGSEFKLVMTLLGGRASRSTKYTGESTNKVRRQARHQYGCKCGKSFEVSTTRHNRIQAGKVKYSCRTCLNFIFYKN